ncbi:arsenic metallochaperone ArsD family protein [Cryobacterium sp. 10C3]|uniref:arsenic metallochaperone ArsD family protein n=1 Tax=Cryobacterium sp. 10C3 TaxID=3048577 RepID=UPI003A0FE024
MAAIRIYEPALCCESGVCGTDTDASLVTVTADVRRLKDLGADIERHNLATDPTAFTTDETVRGFMHTVGSKGLPDRRRRRHRRDRHLSEPRRTARLRRPR